jgi:hypothetical protein
MISCIDTAPMEGVTSTHRLGSRVSHRSLRKGLSRVTGTRHARFLGEGGGRKAAPLTRRPRTHHLGPCQHPRTHLRFPPLSKGPIPLPTIVGYLQEPLTSVSAPEIERIVPAHSGAWFKPCGNPGVLKRLYSAFTSGTQ